tara:strand:+ start:984 stop:1754 length:771 start_codon:yes stop_codon:yes gene_type:complete
MNKGTKEGILDEIYLTKELNKKNNRNLWKIFDFDFTDHYAVHVKNLKYGKVNKKKIWPKADIFIVKSSNILESVLKKNNFYLNEYDIKNLKYSPVPYSGISVKRRDSKRFQIMKIGVSTFEKLFKNLELGAGASIYCRNSSDLIKNDRVLEGWNTNWDKFNRYFQNHFDYNIDVNSDLNTFKQIKKISNSLIEKSIINNKKLNDFIFKGIGNFEEPFTAHYLFQGNEMKFNYSIPFKITTGSGRSKGNFTIVLKPQ